MGKPIENPQVREYWEELQPDGSYRPREGKDLDVPLERWRLGFESFKKFDYSSTQSRLDDLGIVHITGVIAYGRLRMWHESLALSEWALQDEDVLRDKLQKETEYSTFLFTKAGDLIRLSREEEALAFYLRESAPLMSDKKTRRIAFMYGKSVFTELRWANEEHDLLVPAYALTFLRKLLERAYPDRRIPVLLREHADNRTCSWREIQVVVCKL